MIAALKQVVVSALAMAQTRLELAGIELIEEKNRLLVQLFTGLAAMLSITLGLIVLTFLIIAHFWDSYRLSSIIVVAVVYFAVGGLLCVRLKRTFENGPPPFQASFEEMSKDYQALTRCLASDTGRPATSSGEHHE
jgi:uncharacterized membrane protein YqjE